MRERIIKVLDNVNSNICRYQGDSLLEDKVIDSFEIMQIVADIEEEFGIEIDAEHIISENFSNMQSIVHMVSLCLEMR